jgi:hypothetical protein
VSKVPECFEWHDYELSGPPNVSLDDYTFCSFGCTQILENYLAEIRKIRAKNESVRWLVLDFWGRGKSTLMYNLCSKINSNLFFSAEVSPTLAVFVDHPQRAEDLLDYSYENGLPIPWTPEEPKENTRFARKQLFANALRILAFAWVKKGLFDKSYKNPDARKGLQCLVGASLLNQNLVRAVEKIDQAYTANRYDAADRFLAGFFKHLQSSGSCDVEEDYDETWEYFPGLVYPETSANFLVSYSKLFAEPRRRLRNFSVFHSLCESVDIHIILVIDEAAEWDYMVKSELDDFLIDLLPTNRLSAILISRADVEKALRGQRRFRYFHLRAYTKHVTLPDPSQAEIFEIAKGVLATSRIDGCMKLSPFSEDFIVSLSNLTVRCGHFNTRMFVRGISTALKLSLDWERENSEISSDLIKKSDLLDALAEDLKLEDKKGLQPLNLMEKAEEIKRKAEAARCISGLLLAGIADPPTRYMLDITKEIVSESYQVPFLSDIEMLAYTKKEERIKVYRIVKELKETSISLKARAYLRDWIGRKVKSYLK